MSKKVITIIVLCCISLSARTDGAEMIFSAVGDIIPIAYEENSQKKGLCYDLFVEANKRLHLDVEVKFYPFPRMWKNLQHGDIDGSIGIYYQKEREEWLIYSDTPMYFVKHSVFVKRGKEFSFDKAEDLYGKRIGRQKGWFITKEFEKAVNEGKIVIDEAITAESNLKKLMDGRIDASVGNHYIFVHYLKVLGLQDKIVVLPKPVMGKKNVYWAISKKSKNIKDKAAFMRRINSVIKEMHRDGTLLKLEMKYIR